MQQKTIGGVDLHYLSLCKRKLWLYKHGISFESESDRVLEGKILHESAYQRLTEKEILIDNSFKIDAIDGEYVREVKISSKMIESDKWQMLFYLYQLHLRGIHKKGLISYTKEKKTVQVDLTENEVENIKSRIAEVYQIIDKDKPPHVVKLPYCKSCSYYEFCFTMEVDQDDA
jgi:CRISPR-associated exonuclease Cas4